jgi:HD superfamily phosphohydrolase
LIKYSNIGELIELNGYNKDVLSRLAIGRSQKKDNFFKNQIISGTVDVDKLDFISRDSYHTGAGYGYIDVFRLIYTMGLHNNKLVVNSTALSTLETFLLARLESFKTIYFHKASRAVQIMLVRALEAYLTENNILNFKNPDDYLNLDDYNMWNLLKTNKTTKQIIDNIEQRKLFKCAYEITLYTKDRLVSSIFTNESVRKRIEEEIAAKAKINIREVIIDVPSLPSVPYSNLSSDPMEIPILFEEDRKKEIKSVGELSQIVNVLKVYMNIVRVYTQNEHREQVRKASENILGSLPSETKISY